MSSKKYCIKCGKQIPANAKFCPYCSAKQPEVDDTASGYTSETNSHVETSRVSTDEQGHEQHRAQAQAQADNYQPNYNAQKMAEDFSNPFDQRGKHYITPKPVSMPQAFVMFWTRYVDFKGYSSRAEYWWWFLWEVIINVILWLAFITTELGGMISAIADGDSDINFTGGPIGLIASLSGFGIIGLIIVIWELARIIPNIALKVRRFRDAGVPIGWTIVLLVVNFIPFIDIISGIACFIISLLPSIRKN